MANFETVEVTTDFLIIGGGMIFTFYKAMGYEIGTSLLEEDRVAMAKELLERSICPNNRRQVEIVLTEKGLKTCNALSKLVDKSQIERKKISEEEAKELNRILDKMRS